MDTIYHFITNMDTFYYFLIGVLFLAMLMEISALYTPGASLASWFVFHFYAAVASFIYVIYIFFLEDLSSAGYALLYTFGYIIIEGILSLVIVDLIGKISK